MSNLGQVTLNDCWISATILCFYMGLYHIPAVKIEGPKVSFPDGRSVILTENLQCEIEIVMRASRVYFSEKSASISGVLGFPYLQKYLDLAKLNKTGCPDTISKLFFGLNFKIYSTSFISFYPKTNIKNIEHMLRNRNPKEVFMMTFKFLPSHLYVYHDISDLNILSLFDVSDSEIKQTNISTSNIAILFRLDLSSIQDM